MGRQGLWAKRVLWQGRCGSACLAWRRAAPLEHGTTPTAGRQQRGHAHLKAELERQQEAHVSLVERPATPDKPRPMRRVSLQRQQRAQPCMPGSTRACAPALPAGPSRPMGPHRHGHPRPWTAGQCVGSAAGSCRSHLPDTLRSLIASWYFTALPWSSKPSTTMPGFCLRVGCGVLTC